MSKAKFVIRNVNMWQEITAMHQVLKKQWQLTQGITISLKYMSQDENILMYLNIKSANRPGASDILNTSVPQMFYPMLT